MFLVVPPSRTSITHLRVPGITREYAGNRRSTEEWDRLIEILDRVEQSTPDQVDRIFDQILVDIYRMLEETKVADAPPARVSLGTTADLIEEFLRARSGGDRLQAVVTTLLRVIGRWFGLFDRVERLHVNASDASSGQVADLECFSGDSLALAVEVKDRDLVFKDLDDKVAAIRQKKAREFLALATGTVVQDSETKQLVDSQYVSGHNIYTFNFDAFVRPLLALLGEEGRIAIIAEVGLVLDEFCGIQHRRAWAALLRKA